MDLVSTLSALVALGARWVLWLLIALSVAALAVIVERALFLFGTREDANALHAETESRLAREGAEGTARRLETSASSEARLAASALRHPQLSGGAASAAAAAELDPLHSARALERLRLERGVSFLGTLAVATPFVGLLGTVIGIVAAFQQLARSQGRLTGALMSEIGEALVATAIGLLVALPALAAFNMFQRVIHVRLTRAEAFARQAQRLALEVSEAPASGRAR